MTEQDLFVYLIKLDAKAERIDRQAKEVLADLRAANAELAAWTKARDGN